MIFLKLVGVIWLSISSMFSIESKESSNYIERHEIVSKEIIERGDYYLMGSGERCSLDALDSIMYWANNIEIYYSNWASGNVGALATDSLYRNLLQDAPVGNNMDNVFYISQVGSNGAPTTIFNARRLRFNSWIVNQTNSRQWIYYLGFGNDGNNEEYGIMWFLFTDITNQEVVEGKRPVIFNSYFGHWTSGYGSAFTPLDTVDYAFSFMEGSTMASMFSNYINDNADADYNNGYNSGYGNGYNSGYNTGFEEGYTEGSSGSPEITSIFTGILDVGLLPVNVFLSIFNFELFGVNVSGLITGMLTIGMIMILLRFIFGGKNDDK